MTEGAYYKTRAKATARRYRQSLDRRYAARRYRTRAVVTSISTDAAGRATGAAATIDGATGQGILIDHGAPIAVGDSFVVENIGTATAAQWATVRKARSVIAVPGVGETPTLPTPSGLALQTGIDSPVGGGGVTAWIHASWQTIGDEWGIMSYELSVRLNDPTEEPFTVTVYDEVPETLLDGAIDDSVALIVRDPEVSPADEYNFAKFGRIKIESELVDYTAVTDGQGDSGTGTGGTNTFTDSGASWGTNEWTNYVLIDSASAQFLVTSNTATVLTVVGTPASGSYYIKPAFTGCTRGAGSSDAASHADNTNIIRRSVGALVTALPPDTDYNARVRARRISDSAVSGWTDWVSIQTDLDTIAPPAPTGLTVADAVAGVNVAWTGPVGDVVLDLAGFEVYTADDDSGTNPVLRLTIGLEYQRFLSWPSGQTVYVNMKAFDYTGNKSGWAEVTWPDGMSLAGGGMQLLTNADFERDIDGDSWPDDYESEDVLGTPIWSWSTNGLQGGHAITLVLDDEEYGRLTFDARDNYKEIMLVHGHYYCSSVFIHTTVDDDDLYLSNINVPDNKLVIWCTPIYTYVSGILTPNMVDALHYRTDGNWIRISCANNSTTPGSSYEHVGWRLVVWNRMGTSQTVHIDRPQLEQDVIEPSEWKPGIVPPGGGSMQGLLIDCGGIKTFDNTFYLDEGGKLHSHLLPDATGTRDLGSSSLKYNTVYADNFVGGDVDHDPVSLATDAQELLTLSAQQIGLVTAGQSNVLAGPSGGAGDPDFRLLGHGELSNVTVDQHHARSHVLSGGYHTESGLTTGHVIRATGITAFSWQQLQHTDLASVSADQHHAQSHILSGGYHTESGLTTGHVIRATGAAAFSWQQLQHSDLTGVSSDQHHNQQHDVVGADHTITASQYDLVGATAVDTIGLLTPSAAPSGIAILRSDSNSGLQLGRLGIGVAPGAADQITMADGATLGQAAGPLLTFDDTGNELSLKGADTFVAYNDGALSVIARRHSDDAVSPDYVSDKSRGSAGSETNIQDGDLLLKMIARGYNSSAWRESAYIAVQADGTPNFPYTPGKIVFSTTTGGILLPGARLTIKASGYVGINTILPDRQLEVLDTAGPQLRLTYVDSSTYTDLLCDVTGLFSITPTGGKTAISGSGAAFTPGYPLHVRHGSSVPQLVLDYDASNWAKFYVGSTGSLEIDTVANIILDPGGQNVNPGGSIEDDMGAYNVMWRALYASELVVETLVAQDIMATIGGRILIAPTTKLMEDLDNTNAVLNWSFETAGGGDPDIFANWDETHGFLSVITQDSAQKYEGTYSCKFAKSGLASSYISQDFAITASKTYWLRFYCRGDGTNYGRWALQDVASGTWYQATTITSNKTTSWAAETFAFTAIAGATTARLYLRDASSSPADSWFDATELLEATIITEHNNLAVNDFLIMKSAPGGVAQTEVFQVIDGPTATNGYFLYGVDRHVAGVGVPNYWHKGDAVVNLGYDVGEGYIELTSTQTIHSQDGPTITIFVRPDVTQEWNSAKPVVTIGNLDSYLGFGTVYGMAIGNDLSLSAPTHEDFQGATITNEDGLQLYNTNLELYDVGTLVVKIDRSVPSIALGNPLPSGYATGEGIWMGKSGSDFAFRVGDPNAARMVYSSGSGQLVVYADDDTFFFTSGAKLRMMTDYSTTHRLVFDLDMDNNVFKIGRDVDVFAETSLVIPLSNIDYNSEALEYGDILIGDNTASKPNVLWNKSAATIEMRAGVTPHIVLDASDGSFWAGNTSATTRLEFDTTYGLQMYDGANVRVFQVQVDGDVVLGQVSTAGKSTLFWDESEGDLLFRTGATNTTVGKINGDGSWWFGDGYNDNSIYWTAASGLRFYDSANNKTFQIQPDGDVQMGVVATGYGNVFFDYSEGTMDFRGGLNGTVIGVQIDGDSGSLLAGVDKVILNSDGIDIILPVGYSNTQAYTFSNSGTTLSRLAGQYSAYVNEIALQAIEQPNTESKVHIHADAPATYGGSITLNTWSGTELAVLQIISDSNSAIPNWISLTADVIELAAMTEVRIDSVIAGDPLLVFQISSTDKWVIGVDDSDGDRFKINYGGSLANPSDFEIDASGNVEIAGSLDIGGSLALDNILNISGITELTLDTSGNITITKSYHTVDTYLDAVSDNLINIYGGTTGDILILRSADGGRDIIIRDTGNIELAATPFTLSTIWDTITFIFDTATWIELSRSNNA